MKNKFNQKPIAPLAAFYSFLLVSISTIFSSSALLTKVPWPAPGSLFAVSLLLDSSWKIFILSLRLGNIIDTRGDLEFVAP